MHARRADTRQPWAGTLRGAVAVGIAVAVALLAAWIGMRLATPRTDLAGFWNPVSWGRFDTGHYVAIARDGYKFGPCEPQLGYAPGSWCGNTTWMPAYPLGIRMLIGMGASQDFAASLIPHAALVAALAVAWVWHLGRGHRDVLVLVLLGVTPGAVYLAASFPMSLTVLGVLVAFALLDRDRPLLAGCAGAFAVLSHTFGILVLPAGVLWLLTEPGRPTRDRLRSAISFGAPGALAYLSVLAYFQLALGRWNAGFLSQEKYGHHLQLPTTRLHGRWQTVVSGPGASTTYAVAVQSLLVAVLCIVLLVPTIRHWRELAGLDRLRAFYLSLVWLVPLAYGGPAAGQYRLESLILPGLVLARRSRPMVIAVLTAACFAVAVGTATLYFESRLM